MIIPRLLLVVRCMGGSQCLVIDNFVCSYNAAMQRRYWSPPFSTLLTNLAPSEPCRASSSSFSMFARSAVHRHHHLVHHTTHKIMAGMLRFVAPLQKDAGCWLRNVSFPTLPNISMDFLILVRVVCGWFLSEDFGCVCVCATSFRIPQAGGYHWLWVLR